MIEHKIIPQSSSLFCVGKKMSRLLNDGGGNKELKLG